MRTFVVGAIIAAVAATPALAQDAAHFQQCDGYPKPRKSNDGIIVSAGGWVGIGRGAQDIRRGNTGTFAPLAIAACERALADPLLKPEYVIRRANLLQAKAYHQVTLEAWDDALATLASIDAVGLDTADPLYQRGIGLGNRLLRALVFVKLDRDAEALAEIESIERDRPYSVSARNTTLKLRLMIAPDLDNHIALLRELAPIHPGAAFEGFMTSLSFGRLEDAVDFGSGLAFDLPSNRGNWTVAGEDLFELQVIEAQAEFDGAFAYALAATGDLEGAATRLLAARARLETIMAPLPPPLSGRRHRKSVIREHEQRIAFGERGKAVLGRWERLTALRREAPDLNLEGLFTRISDFPQGSIPVLPDIVARLGQEEEATRAEVVRGLLELLQQQRTAEAAIDTDKFMSALPRPEIPATQVKFRRAADGWMSNHGGFTRREMDGADDWTIRFEDNYASHGTVEEFSMLAAATEARDRGYDGILLQSRRLLERTTNTYGMYSSGSYNSGREAQLRIRMVKRAELPQDLAGSEWRVLDVAKVLADLSGLPTRPES